jgi:hypothetical protein
MEQFSIGVPKESNVRLLSTVVSSFLTVAMFVT